MFPLLVSRNEYLQVDMIWNWWDKYLETCIMLANICVFFCIFANRHFLKCTYLFCHACLPALLSVCLYVYLIVHIYLTISKTTGFELWCLRVLLWYSHVDIASLDSNFGHFAWRLVCLSVCISRATEVTERNETLFFFTQNTYSLNS